MAISSVNCRSIGQRYWTGSPNIVSNTQESWLEFDSNLIRVLSLTMDFTWGVQAKVKRLSLAENSKNCVRYKSHDDEYVPVVWGRFYVCLDVVLCENTHKQSYWESFIDDSKYNKRRKRNVSKNNKLHMEKLDQICPNIFPCSYF